MHIKHEYCRQKVTSGDYRGFVAYTLRTMVMKDTQNDRLFSTILVAQEDCKRNSQEGEKVVFISNTFGSKHSQCPPMEHFSSVAASKHHSKDPGSRPSSTARVFNHEPHGNGEDERQWTLRK